MITFYISCPCKQFVITYQKSDISSCSDIPHYRNLFNGQEADNEVYGNGAVLGYEFRQYDSRIGRWWSIDPMADKYPGVSPYVFCGGSPIIIKDRNGGYGVVVIKQQCDDNGNITGGTAALVMTFYYNSAENFEGDGKMSTDQALWVQRNIQSNLNFLYQEDIVINGVTYKFDYEIEFVDLASPEHVHKNPYKEAEFNNYKNTGIRKGNFMEAATLAKGGDLGAGSQYSIRIDFAKMSQYVQVGWSDGQTPTHELFHTIGASDTKNRGGTRLMDYNNPDNSVPVPMRWIMMNDIENLFYDGNERLQIIYEDE